MAHVGLRVTAPWSTPVWRGWGVPALAVAARASVSPMRAANLTAVPGYLLREPSVRMAPNKKELDAQLRDLGERHAALAEIVQRLATHAAVLAVAVRDPEGVPTADLDAALSGLSEISAALVGRR